MFPYENLAVYKKAFEVNRKVYAILREKKTLPDYIKKQLGRATLSIILNIAEGSWRFANKDRRNFFITARGSTFECAATIHFLFAENELTQIEMTALKGNLEEISKILFTMIKNLG